MYKLTIINKFGVSSVIYNDDLERLKVVAKRLNKQGCDVEISTEVTLFRVVSLNK
jgi:hypothetical protein